MGLNVLNPCVDELPSSLIRPQQLAWTVKTRARDPADDGRGINPEVLENDDDEAVFSSVLPPRLQT